MTYFLPLLHSGPDRSDTALTLGGGWCWFDHVLCLDRGQAPRRIVAEALPTEVMDTLTRPRAQIAEMPMDMPQVMGILNVTPDSFSDGGLFDNAQAATAQARRLMADGAAILDIGGESTRPGAKRVLIADEIDRTVPLISALCKADIGPISIDTRKAPVAQAATDAGAGLINDVSAFGFDPGMAEVAARTGVPVCLMHAQGAPETMQDDPQYKDVLFDVYDALRDARDRAIEAGVAADKIVLDPGIGFGKTTAHNLTLLQGLALFHTLGCPILLGASRKRFIGEIGGADAPRDRMPGSVAVALHAVRQGIQIVRVHDVSETVQAVRLWMAVSKGEFQ